MKMKTVALLVVAVVLGTVASRFTKRLFSDTTELVHEGAEKVVVLAAKQSLPAGAVLHEPDRLFEERTLGQNEAPARAIHVLFQLRGRKLAKAIDAQAIITTDTLVDEEGANVELVKREGRQAIAIAVRPPSGQLFVPQARVDVIWTASGVAAESRIVAQDLPLLGLQARDAATVIATVGAKQAEAEKLAQAASQGTLRLVARQSK